MPKNQWFMGKWEKRGWFAILFFNFLRSLWEFPVLSIYYLLIIYNILIINKIEVNRK
jgi:hypothetical protein